MSIATLGAFGIKEYPEAVMVMVLYQIARCFRITRSANLVNP